MTMLRLLILAAALFVSASAGAAGPHVQPSATASLVHQAKYVCGKFETGWGCRYESGEVESGKSSIPNVGVKRPDEQPPLAPPPAPGQVEAAAPATVCKGGAAGASPGTCRCPANSEQLGGACVRYTARCNKALAAIGPVEACAGAEERLACKIRADGLRDCCCLTYEK